MEHGQNPLLERRRPGRRQFVETEFSRGVLRVKPVGPAVGAREATIITEDVQAIMARHDKLMKFLVIDLSSVSTICSMGLGMCIDLRNHANRQRAKSVLFGLKPEVAQMFRTLRIERLYTIARTAAELDRLAA